MYGFGRGTTPSYKDALQWYKKAADSGYGIARVRVAEFQANSDAFAAGCSSSLGSAVYDAGKTVFPLQQSGGTFTIPVLVNNAITLNFVLDSGAADVSIPEDVFRTLIRAGTITREDVLGMKAYTLADGSTRTHQTFRIRSLTLGNRVFHDIIGTASAIDGPLLLGQSLLGRFKSWSIDNQRRALVVE